VPVSGEVYKQIGRNAAGPVCIAAAYDRVTGAVVGLTASSFVTLSFERVLPLLLWQPRPACVEAREHKCPT